MQETDDKSIKYNIYTSKFVPVWKEYAKEIGHPFKYSGQKKAVRGFWQIEKVSPLFENITPSGLTADNPKCRYDAYWQVGKRNQFRILEHKFKECISTYYPDFTISPDKVEFIINENGLLLVVYDDGVFYLWDLKKYTPWQAKVPTSHKKYSSDFGGQDNPDVDEYMYHFEFDKASFTGSISEECSFAMKITH